MAGTKVFRPEELFGILPPLVTPFTADEEVNEAALRTEARYMMGQGVHGLVGGGSAGEGFTLLVDELRRIVAVIAEEAAGRLPVIAGIITNSTRDAIARARAVADLGVSALQITPVHYICKSDDEAMVRHFRAIHEAVGIPILVYNVVPWNYLSPALLLRMMKDVPGVVGVKQSAGDMKLLADLLLHARPQDRIFAALDALVYPTLALGSHGVISQILAAIPGPCVELWNAVQAKDHTRALELHRKMLVLWNAIAGDNRLAVTKYTLSLQGVPTGNPRAPLTPASPAQRQAAERALADLIGADNVRTPAR